MTARRRNAGGEVRRGRLFRTELFRMRMTQCNAARAGSRHSVLQETHPVHKRVDREQSKASMILCRPYGKMRLSYKKKKLKITIFNLLNMNNDDNNNNNDNHK